MYKSAHFLSCRGKLYKSSFASKWYFSQVQELGRIPSPNWTGTLFGFLNLKFEFFDES